MINQRDSLKQPTELFKHSSSLSLAQFKGTLRINVESQQAVNLFSSKASLRYSEQRAWRL